MTTVRGSRPASPALRWPRKVFLKKGKGPPWHIVWTSLHSMFGWTTYVQWLSHFTFNFFFFIVTRASIIMQSCICLLCLCRCPCWSRWCLSFSPSVALARLRDFFGGHDNLFLLSQLLHLGCSVFYRYMNLNFKPSSSLAAAFDG